ncbi:CRISPR-associated endonuclease Cas2 [Geobacillus sp. YF-1]|uniref:CRISPR-associated endonuclease Cas2 n=1 Tax=Geobacillus sp. YF-1 TaxID=3457480 RepID=UPI0040457CD1
MPSAPPSKSYYLVCYDIEDTKKRNKLAKWLLNYGIRVQKSVFEAYLTAAEAMEMMEGARPWIGEGDSLRVYELTVESYENKQVIGTPLEHLPWNNLIV